MFLLSWPPAPLTHVAQRAILPGPRRVSLASRPPHSLPGAPYFLYPLIARAFERLLEIDLISRRPGVNPLAIAPVFDR